MRNFTGKPNLRDFLILLSLLEINELQNEFSKNSLLFNSLKKYHVCYWPKGKQLTGLLFKVFNSLEHKLEIGDSKYV